MACPRGDGLSEIAHIIVPQRRAGGSSGTREVAEGGVWGRVDRIGRVWFSDTDSCTAPVDETTPWAVMWAMKAKCERCRTWLDKRFHCNNI